MKGNIVYPTVNHARVVNSPADKLWVVNFSDSNGGFAELSESNKWDSGRPPQYPNGNYKIQLSFGIFQTKRAENNDQVVIEGRKAGSVNNGDGFMLIKKNQRFDSWYGEAELNGKYLFSDIPYNWEGRWNYFYNLYRGKSDKVTSDRLVRRIGARHDGADKFNGHIITLSLEDMFQNNNSRLYFFAIESETKPTTNRVIDMLHPDDRDNDFILTGYDSMDQAWVEAPPGLFLPSGIV